MSTNTISWTTRFRSYLLTTFVAVTLFGCSPVFSPAVQPSKGGAKLAETGRVYALVETQGAANKLWNAARTLGYTPRRTTDLDGLSLVMITVDLPDGTTGLEAINALEAAVPSSTVGVNHAYRLQQVSSSVTDRRSYANTLMQWPEGGCRSRNAIGLIDGSVDANAAIFAGVKLRTQSFGTGSASSRQHGTEVASVLVDPARLKNVSLFNASVIEVSETGEDLAGAAALVQAINWMASKNVSLVNISLAGPPNKLLREAVVAAQSRGMVIVAAVGNNGRSEPVQFPAALPKVIAVTALDANKRIFRNAVRGPNVDFAAPGVDIFVPSETGGRYVSGTSMAAPFVTAYLATQAKSSASKMISTLDLGPAGRDTIFGNGLVQVVGGCTGSN